MPASSIDSSIRTPLANAFSGVAANVYSYVPEAPQVPAVILVPDSPYLELNTINDSTLHAKINLVITCGVAYLSNPASLDNLEKLIMSVLAVIPDGYIVGLVERPTVTQVGTVNLLTADIRVSTYYTQTN
jgi:hypothetical protein